MHSFFQEFFFLFRHDILTSDLNVLDILMHKENMTHAVISYNVTRKNNTAY